PAGQLLLAGAAPADSQAQSLTAGEVPTDKSARKDYCLNTEHPFLGYIARPLNGIWATASLPKRLPRWGRSLTATISFALRKPMKPPGLIVCWSATGP
ncbi:hypothetical protein JTL63_35405, partial [Pseudomonas aeruginosa]|nr:hypothetical protein [Pseudomonas aeruginosa]